MKRRGPGKSSGAHQKWQGKAGMWRSGIGVSDVNGRYSIEEHGLRNSAKGCTHIKEESAALRRLLKNQTGIVRRGCCESDVRFGKSGEDWLITEKMCFSLYIRREQSRLQAVYPHWEQRALTEPLNSVFFCFLDLATLITINTHNSIFHSPIKMKILHNVPLKAWKGWDILGSQQ